MEAVAGLARKRGLYGEKWRDDEDLEVLGNHAKEPQGGPCGMAVRDGICQTCTVEGRSAERMID